LLLIVIMDILELTPPGLATEVLLLHAPYPGPLKFNGIPSGPLAAIGTLARLLAARGELDRLSLLDPGSANDDYRADLRAALSNSHLRVLLISTSTASIEEAIAAANLARRLRGPELLIVLGGPHEDGVQEKAAHKIPEVDVSISGEVENVLAALVTEFLTQDEPPGAFLRAIPSASWNTLVGGGVKIATRALGRASLELPLRRLKGADLVAPVWSTKKPEFSVFEASETLPVMASRGCPYGQCTFCAEANRSGVIVHADFHWLRELANLHPGAALYFQDSIFPAGQSVQQKLLPLLRDLERPWGCQVFLPTLTEASVRKLAEAGCRYLYTGIESASPAVLDGIGKSRLRAKLVLERLSWIREADMSVGLSLMFGALSEQGELLETTNSLEQTTHLVEQIAASGTRVAGLYPNITTVLPGTPLARGLATAGFDLDFYCMPRSEIFSGFEDGVVGYNFTTVPGLHPRAPALAEQVLATAELLRIPAGSAW